VVVLLVVVVIKAWQPGTFCLDFPRSGLVNMVTRYDLQYLLIM
jgi:hypothetical protein